MDKIIQGLEQKIKQLEQHKSDYWRGVRDGYISSLDFIEQLNKPVVSGKPLVCPDCQTTNLHHMGHGAWCCAFCGGNSKPMACASGAMDKTVSVDKCECYKPEHYSTCGINCDQKWKQRRA